MRAFWCLALVAIASPAVARDPIVGSKAHYYGPLKNGYGAGYKDELRKDGSWRVVADSRLMDGEGFSLNVVMYRAAERARAEGFAYVQMINLYGIRSRFGETAVLIARPSASPAAPDGCKPKICYTASAARVMAMLGGPGGNQPGIAVPSYLDQYGREVTITGFGVGAVLPDGTPRIEPLPKGARSIPVATPVATPAAPVRPMPFVAPVAQPVVPVMASASPYPAPPRRAHPVDQPTYEDRLRAAQPVRGGDRRQGWTISD